MKKLVSTCLIAITLIITTPTALAAESEETTETTEREVGALGINVNVIHDTREATAQHYRFIGHEVAPNLFLSEKTQAEYIRRQRNRNHLSLVQEQLFTVSDIDTRVSDFETQTVLALLFAEGSFEPSRVMALPQYLETVHIPTWIIAMFVVLGMGVVACIGIIAGRHLSHLLHGRKQSGE